MVVTTNYSICPGSSMQSSTSSIYNWNKVATNCSFCRERGMSTLAVSSSTRSGTRRCNIITTSYCRDNYSTCWESIKTSITLGVCSSTCDKWYWRHRGRNIINTEGWASRLFIYCLFSWVNYSINRKTSMFPSTLGESYSTWAMYNWKS